MGGSASKNSEHKPEGEGLLAMGARPLGLLVFLASAGGLLTLEWASHTTVVVPAVGHASATIHSAPTRGRVEAVYARPGDHVEEGAPLLTLASDDLTRALREVDAEIRRTIKEGHLEQARLEDRLEERDLEVRMRLSEARRASARARAAAAHQESSLQTAQASAERVAERVEERLLSVEERWRAERQLAEERAAAAQTTALLRAELSWAGALRRELDGDDEPPSLTRATVELYEAELELLKLRRELIETDLRALTVHAGRTGMVATLVEIGAFAERGTPLVRVVPERAEEVVAYLPAETGPGSVILDGELTVATAEDLTCVGHFAARRGAEVAALPTALNNATRTMGLPVHVELPEQCPIGVGQVVSLTLRTP